MIANVITAAAVLLFDIVSTFRTARSESDHIIWFGHYPTSSIVSPSPGVRQAMSGALCYLCGHYHSMFGLVRQMYTRQHTGVRELELEDWMRGSTGCWQWTTGS